MNSEIDNALISTRKKVGVKILNTLKEKT